MATARQIAANQANSLRSTGPRSPEGKSISRANSCKHGLSGRGIVLPRHELDAIEERFVRWHDTFQPSCDFGSWLVETIAVESVRVDRCRLHEVALRLRMVDRAEDFWDIDRRLAAAELAAQLPRKPEKVVWQLQQTIQGVDLLIGRWEYLGKTLAMTGTWDDQQRSTALDLLGVPRDRRQGWTELVPDPGDFLTEAEWFGQHVECRLRDLKALRKELEKHDADERARAIEGHPSSTDAELKRLRRYETGCLRRLQWAVAGIKALKRQGAPAPSPDPDDPGGCPMTPEDSERERLELEEQRLRDERRKAWMAQAAAQMKGGPVVPVAAVAEVPREEGPDDDATTIPAESVAGPDDVATIEETSPMPAATSASETRGLLKPVPLASAMLKAVPGNRRARRAAKSRARKG
jgi:hypothetical protein